MVLWLSGNAAFRLIGLPPDGENGNMAIHIADLLTTRNIGITSIPLIAFAAICVAGIVACCIDVVTAYRDMEELQRENDGE